MNPGRTARVAGLCALLLALAVRAAPAPAPGQAVDVPALSLADGARMQPDALRGKVVVFAWFASWCPYCMQEAPKLQRLYAANAGHVQVIGVNVEQADPRQAAKVAQWVARYGWTFPVVIDSAALERALGKPKGIPALVVLDRRGTVRQVESGEMLDEDFDDIAAFARGDAP